MTGWSNTLADLRTVIDTYGSALSAADWDALAAPLDIEFPTEPLSDAEVEHAATLADEITRLRDTIEGRLIETTEMLQANQRHASAGRAYLMF